MEILRSYYDTLQLFGQSFAEQVPKYMAAMLLLVLGWILARLIERLFVRIFRLIGLENMAEKAGIENFLYRGGVKFTTSTLLAKLVYWIIMFTVTLAVLNSLGLQSAAELFNRMLLYIPNLIVAFIVLLFGTLFAKFVHTASMAYLNNIGITGAEGLSLVIKYAILIFVASMVLEQLNIGGQVLVSGFQIAFGSLCLALALAFGLGGRDWAAKVIERLWKIK